METVRMAAACVLRIDEHDQYLVIQLLYTLVMNTLLTKLHTSLEKT